MTQHIWYEVTPTDVVRIKKLMKQYRSLVGFTKGVSEADVLEAYQGNIVPDTAHLLVTAHDTIEEMIRMVDQYKKIADAVTDMSLRSLRRELRNEQERLATVINAFGMDVNEV